MHLSPLLHYNSPLPCVFLCVFSYSQTRDQAHRYDGVFSVCKQVNVSADIQNFVRQVRPKGSNGVDEAIISPRHHIFKPVLDHPSTPKVRQ